jgi:hypothetical protein
VSLVRTARRWPATLALAALALPAAVHAESLYVVEQLVVNVNSAPDASGERIATVKSGERVEVLERAGQQIHVRLMSGTDGWIRAGYLSADEPLRTKLAQRDAEVAQLRAALARETQPSLSAPAAPAAGTAPPAPAAGTAPPAPAAGTAPPAPAAAPPAADATAAPPAALFGLRSEEQPRRVWPWALSAALLAFGAGFALGVLALDRRIRRKYGGLRIY